MAYQDLREWISALDKAGELKRIKAEADPILEIAEITDRVSKWGPRGKHGPGGPALLFENVKGYPGAKVLINQFGSERRMRMALDVDSLDEIADRIKYFMDVKSPQGLLDKIKMLPMLAEMGKFFPKEVSTGPCKEVIKRDNFSLLDFPILQCWPLDGGRFITLPSVITKDPKTGKRNAGTYRLQIYDAQQHGHALAAPEAGRRTLSRADAPRRRSRRGKSRQRRARYDGALRRRLARGGRQAGWRKNGSRGRHRHRAGGDVFLHRARAARYRGVPDRRLPAPEAAGAGEVRDRRSGSAGDVGDRARRLRPARRAAHGRPVRRSHRLLHAGRSLSRLPRHLRHASQESRSTRRRLSASRRWKTPTWAKRSSASSCR